MNDDERVANLEDPGRRKVLGLGVLLGAGLAGSALPQDSQTALTSEVLSDAEKLIGLEFTDQERDLMLEDLEELREKYASLRRLELPNEVAPALRFDPLPPAAGGTPPEAGVAPDRWTPGATQPAQALEELAFAPVTRLAPLLASGEVSSVDLTHMFLDRIERLDGTLLSVVTVTRELALEQAARADSEIAAGRYCGPLHGVPWGAKDLLSARRYPTTWGATPFRDQVIDENATVVERLEEAGAVMIAKLSLGALAWGDVWFGGQTRNPWNPEQGSSGSSAGPAAAVAAGLVSFAIGSETLGSIVSPSTRCGVTGLRPTFGRVSRHGAMALSWSMDKLGPMARSAADCALVLEAISGRDGRDPTAVGEPFRWRAGLDKASVRLGWLPELFEREPEEDEDPLAGEWRELDLASITVLRGLGFDLAPIELPDLPVAALSFVLTAEAAAAFQELTLSGRDDRLVLQIANAWPNVFRQGQLIPAVEYIQANRVRTLLLREMEQLFERVDAYVAPSFGGNNLLLTNLTGHPTIVLPNGFRTNGAPTSLSFVGGLFGESELATVASAYQGATDFHRRQPQLG